MGARGGLEYLLQLVHTAVVEGQGSGGQAVEDHGSPEDGHHLSLPTAGSEEPLVEVSGEQRAGREEGAVSGAHHCCGDDTTT